MKELKRNEYLEKIEKSQNKRDFQSSDHSNAIAGDGTVAKYYENVDIREVGSGGALNASSSNQYEILLGGETVKVAETRAVYITKQVISVCDSHGMGNARGRFDSTVYDAVDAIILYGVGPHERLRDV